MGWDFTSLFFPISCNLVHRIYYYLYWNFLFSSGLSFKPVEGFHKVPGWGFLLRNRYGILGQDDWSYSVIPHVFFLSIIQDWCVKWFASLFPLTVGCLFFCLFCLWDSPKFASEINYMLLSVVLLCHLLLSIGAYFYRKPPFLLDLGNLKVGSIP